MSSLKPVIDEVLSLCSDFARCSGEGEYSPLSPLDSGEDSAE
jgi:hypothetical protein